MEDATLDEYTDLDVDPRIRAGIAPRYVGLDAEGRTAVRKFIDQTARFDAETRVGLRAAYSRGDIDIQTGEANTIAEEIQDYSNFKRVTKIDQTGRGTNVEAEVIGDDGTDISVTGRFYGDGDRYVRTLLQENANTVESVFTRNGASDLYDSYGTDAIKHLDEVSDGTAVNIRGQLGEEVLQPDLARSKYGRGSFRYDPDSQEGSLDNGYIREDDIPYNLDGSEQGFDGFAVDDDGNLVIIETKVKNANGRVTNAKWLGDRLGSGNRQMSDAWIENKFESLVQSAESPKQKEFIRRLADDDGPDAIDISERGGRIQLTDVNTGKIRKELIAYQDTRQTGELASSSLRQTSPREPNLDSVEVIKIGTIFRGI